MIRSRRKQSDDDKKKEEPPPEEPLPEQDDKNLGDSFTRAGEGKDLTNAQQ